MLKSKTSAIKKILAIRTDRFGEFILTLPAIHALKEKFPGALLTVMANPYSAQLIKRSPDVDAIIEYKESDFNGFSGTLKLALIIKSNNFDAAIIFNPKRKFNIAAFLAGIPLRVGYDRKWGFLLNRKISDLKHHGIKHEMEYNFDLIKTIGVETGEIVFNISIDKDDDEKVSSILSKANVGSFCVVHPWTSNADKQWPVSRFIELIRRLVDELNQTVVLIGGKDEVASADSFVAGLGRNILNLSGRLTLSECAALLKKSRFLISNDSGPVHLAAAVKIPVIAIFRRGLPGVSSRRWGPCCKGNLVIEKENLSDITVEEILLAVKKLSSGKS